MTPAPVQEPLAHHARDYVPYPVYGIQSTYVTFAHERLNVAVQVLRAHLVMRVR